ncbi:PIG-L family deacetylase [Kineosporia rhizophila]|nr:MULTISPECIES: PIG-L family deacetylase [Kineosporia]MCE0538253.1 PIG-L family deacetylase [Kineosporia rhizophila]GLY18691.1 hypothetical protein Kisp01_57050 [Kineosporia sp. NBRC 101677]
MTGSDSLQDHDSIIVLSPHLDDAALSCGSLIARAAISQPVTVMTLFTSSTAGRVSLSARAFLRQCNARSASLLFEQRRAEDRVALRSIGVTGVHLGLADALFRQREKSRLLRIASRLVPELSCVYPTFRRHIDAGRVSPHDRPLLDALEKRILLASGKGDLVLAPLGLGGHVDHVFTHELGARLSRHRSIGWYADQPYVLRAGAPGEAPTNTERVVHEVDRGVKTELISWYGTQVTALFGTETVPHLEEYVYLPRAAA